MASGFTPFELPGLMVILTLEHAEFDLYTYNKSWYSGGASEAVDIFSRYSRRG
jgi:hypothetical protein